MEEIGLPHWPQVRSDVPAPLLMSKLHASLFQPDMICSNPGIRFKLEPSILGPFYGLGALLRAAWVAEFSSPSPSDRSAALRLEFAVGKDNGISRQSKAQPGGHSCN